MTEEINDHKDQTLLKKEEVSGPPKIIFTLLTLTNVLINLDHGILPACTTNIQEHFDMDQFEYGLLGSIVYLGIVLAGTTVGRFYLKVNSKFLTLLALISLEFTLFLFILSDHKWTGYVSRFLTGICQVFLLIYYPVWIDKFGQHLKTTWLTLLQICVPLGIFVGYGITAIIVNSGHNYQYSFWIQIFLVAIFIISFALISKEKLDCRRKREEEHEDSFLDTIPVIKDSLIDSEITSPHPQQDILKHQHSNNKNQKYWQMMAKLVKSKMYLVGTFTMSVILFVSTGIQFWLTHYFIEVLNFEPVKVNTAYGVVSLTGPTLGCAFGGFLVNKIGGYENPRTIYIVFGLASIGIGCAVIIPFVDGFWVASTLLWLVLFFGGGMMPGLTGIMIVSVPPYLRAFGNSNGEIIKNIFGYLPAPFMYGWFDQMFGNRAGIKLIMFWGLIAPFLLLLGSIHQYRKLKRLQSQGPSLKRAQSIESDSTSSLSPRKMPSTESIPENQTSQENKLQSKNQQQNLIINQE